MDFSNSLWGKVSRLNAAKDAGGVGYAEPGKVYTYDGQAEDLVTLEVGNTTLTYAHVANNAPHLATMVNATASTYDGERVTVSKEDCTLQKFEDGKEAVFVNIGFGSIPFAVWVEGDLYVYSYPSFGYCSRLEFAETIHPIDPKFLAGDIIRSEAVSTAMGDATNSAISSGSSTQTIHFANDAEKAAFPKLLAQASRIRFATGGVEMEMTIACKMAASTSLEDGVYQVAGNSILVLYGMVIDMKLSIYVGDDGEWQVYCIAER